MRLFLLATFLFCETLLLAQTIQEESYQTDNSEKMITKGEELLLPVRNSVTGVYDKFYSLSDDRHRHTLQLATQLNPLYVGQLLQLGYQIDQRIDDFWASFWFSLVQAKFQTFSETPQNSRIRYPKNNREMMFNFGAGVSYTFLSPEVFNIFHIVNLFHTTTFHLTYNQLNESTVRMKYTGLGLNARYGLYKRLSTNLQIGPQIAYHLAVLRRGQKYAGEEMSDRRLILSWMSLGIDFSYYF